MSQLRRRDAQQISQFSIFRRATVQTPVITDHATYVEYQDPEIDGDHRRKCRLSALVNRHTVEFHAHLV